MWYYRKNDVNEGFGCVSYGSVLWQFWYHGYFQLEGNWSAGQGYRLVRNDEGEGSQASLFENERAKKAWTHGSKNVQLRDDDFDFDFDFSCALHL